MESLQSVSDKDLLEEVKRRKLNLLNPLNRPKSSPAMRKSPERQLSPIKSKSSPTLTSSKVIEVKTYEKNTNIPRSKDCCPQTYYIPSFTTSNRHPSFSKAKRFNQDPRTELSLMTQARYAEAKFAREILCRSAERSRTS